MKKRLLYTTFEQSLTLLLNFCVAVIQRVCINHVSFVEMEKTERVLKHRVWWSRALIVIGNWVFYFRRPSIRVLPTREWLDWEQAIKLSNRSNKPLVTCQRQDRNLRELITEKICGETLADLLRCNETDETRKLRLIGFATQSLLRLHQRRVASDSTTNSKQNPATERSEILLSHADATAQNVMIDLETEIAEWFDFDLQHDLREPAAIRHGDDLRALLFSIIYCCRWNDLQKVVNNVHRNYPTTEVWQALKEQISSRRFRRDIFHQAQIRRSRESHQKNESSLNVEQQEVDLVNAILFKC